MQLTIDGIVLRNYKSGADRILKIMTQERGVITAFANKAASPRSKISTATELLCYSNFVLFHHRDRYVVDHADANRIFFGLRADFEKLCLASYFAQLTAELCPLGEPSAEPMRLLLNTLHFLEDGSRSAKLLKPLYELRLLTLTGFMPNLVACRGCGVYESEPMRFFPVSGELLCSDCHARDHATGGVAIDPGVLAAMRHLIYSTQEKLFSFRLGEPGLTRLSELSEQYLLGQVEKSFTALSMYKSALSPI